MPFRCRSRQGPFRRCELRAIHVFLASPHKRGGVFFDIRQRERIKSVEQLQFDVDVANGYDDFAAYERLAMRRAMIRSHRTSAIIAIAGSLMMLTFLFYVLLIVPQP